MSNTSPGKQRARSGSLFSRNRPSSSQMSCSQRTKQDRNTDDTTHLGVGDRPYTSARQRANSSSSQYLGRTPARSFYHRAFHGQADPVEYSSSGVRDQTAELASFAVSDTASFRDTSPTRFSISSEDDHPNIIEEVPEPVSPTETQHTGDPDVSALTQLIQKLPGYEEEHSAESSCKQTQRDTTPDDSMSLPEADEHTSLIGDGKSSKHCGSPWDVEQQRKRDFVEQRLWKQGAHRAHNVVYTLSHPKTWNLRSIYRGGLVAPVKRLPSVFLGLLLNVLDALSYGMILFPLGHPVFESLGSDGISMFYVSTIIAQVIFSSGFSVFKGGIGSEMIEVVPFFHKMAYTIMGRVGEDRPTEVLATTILAFAVSAFITGAVFFLMGACKLGTLIGFFPRHILIGCIGGVGWFLVATGIEVSARLGGNLEYDLPTLRHLMQTDTIMLWLTPLLLAIILTVTRHRYNPDWLVGAYMIGVGVIFYIVKASGRFEMELLRDRGWVFEAVPEGNPWYHFYELYNFKLVHWGALADTIPAMFALTFFGILHVPINVPALGIATNEDNLNIDRELMAHGVSNCLSGCFGSIQNYLVYTNSLMFMKSGGADRLAGLMLAAATFAVMLIGPVIIGYIPVMVVGALIFLLGFELLEEALIGTWGKLHKLDYGTIVVIVVTMGAWDFVVGILVGIILAALNFVVQSSRRDAVRATYSGRVAISTVRRPPVQRKVLQETGSQTMVLKLSGFLFFGTIVGVENKIRSQLEDETFGTRPLRFLVLDMTAVGGLDYSAAEAFSRINRLLDERQVKLIIAGIDLESEVGEALCDAEVLKKGGDNIECYPNLNSALENCENKLLRALYRQQEHIKRRKASLIDMPNGSKSESVQIPSASDFPQSYQAEFVVSSPRNFQLHQAATNTLDQNQSQQKQQKWSAFKQPLPLLLQIFEDLSDQKEDFWHRAVPFFTRQTVVANTTLFSIGDQPSGFYILEEGELLADYKLPQGQYTESIVKGCPCGELPFFSDTLRTATVTAAKDCVVWTLDRPGWERMQGEERDVAKELLRVCLKLTKERMDVITSFVLTMAS